MVRFSYPLEWKTGQPPVRDRFDQTPVVCEWLPLRMAVRDGQQRDVGMIPV